MTTLIVAPIALRRPPSRSEDSLPEPDFSPPCVAAVQGRRHRKDVVSLPLQHGGSGKVAVRTTRRGVKHKISAVSCELVYIMICLP